MVDLIRIEAMSLAMPNVAGGLNRHPFEGVLCPLAPSISDNPPHGTGGRRISLLEAAATRAIPSLLGMPIDVSADFTSHSEKHKVGVITSAEIRAGAIHVAGHLFSENFPTEVATIRANRDSLGMSFEARQISCVDTSAPVLVISDLQFVGACILRRSAAAYTLTSLAASADMPPRKVSANSAVSAYRTWTEAVALFDSVGLTAPDNGRVYPVEELDRKMSALGLDHDTKMDVKTAAINCRLL